MTEDKIGETIEYIMDNGLENCEMCGEFESGDDLTDGMCASCIEPNECNY